MPSYQEIKMVSGATLPALQFQYTDPTGAPIDITGYSVAVEIKRADGTFFTRTASITSATSGTALFVWQLTDWTAQGRYYANFVLTDPQGGVLKVGGLLFWVSAAYHS